MANKKRETNGDSKKEKEDLFNRARIRTEDALKELNVRAANLESALVHVTVSADEDKSDQETEKECCDFDNYVNLTVEAIGGVAGRLEDLASRLRV